MTVYQCSFCYELSQDEKYKGDGLKCPKCGKGYMRKYSTSRTAREKVNSEKPVSRCFLTCCISCGRDTNSTSGICHLCKPLNKSIFRANSETKDRKFIKINNARSGEGLE